jgi:hypothetical protein
MALSFIYVYQEMCKLTHAVGTWVDFVNFFFNGVELLGFKGFELLEHMI